MSLAIKDQLKDNPKYRQYAYSVEKVLKGFESSSDWADLISALGKLNKVLNAKFKVIPKKITIGKRLAQCMHPALPGGVHLKALEVYHTLFSILEKKTLTTDLYIYSVGIFPLFANASMQVRPMLLQLYETHFLPLDDDLIFCIEGMLLGLLPGIEEGTEHFLRTDSLLERICNKVSNLEFFGALWRCVLSSPIVRLPALQLVLRRFDRKKSTDDQLFVIGSDVEVMVQALCEALRDNSALTQRASLDVLVLCCPLSDIPLSKVDVSDLLYSALHCVLRRDMSLNRRLYSWVLGYDLAKSQPNLGESETYFEVFSKDLLIKAFCKILNDQMIKINICPFKINIIEELHPLRMVISLLDKPEIGPLIIEDILFSVFRFLKTAIDYAIKKAAATNEKYDNQENMKNSEMIQIAKASNLLFNAFEPVYLWQYFSQLLNLNMEEKRNNVVSEHSFIEICNFVCLLLDLTTLENYQETPSQCISKLLYDVINSLVSSLNYLNFEELDLGLRTCKKLLDLSQPTLENDVNFSMDAPKTDDGKLGSQILIMSFGARELVDNFKGLSTRKKVPEVPVPYVIEDKFDVGHSTRLFHIFFTNFVLVHLGVSKKFIDYFVAQLEIPESQLNPVPNEQQSNASPHKKQELSELSDRTDRVLSDQEVVDLFQLICQLLVDFACFPVYCTGRRSSSLNNSGYHLTNNDDVLGFPFWLRCLLWVICGKPLQAVHSSFDILFLSLNAFLDLLALMDTSASGSCGSFKEADSLIGKTSVVVACPLTIINVITLNTRTKFYQEVTKEIWKVLDEQGISKHHLDASQLLVYLHSICPDDRCEDVILEEMMHFNKKIRTKALSKFCSLWHLTRILHAKKSFITDSKNKQFDRCLYAVYDSLSFSIKPLHRFSPPFASDNSDSTVVFSITSSWLHHCLMEGDIVRVLDPLLLIALHPRTHSTAILSLSDARVKLRRGARLHQAKSTGQIQKIPSLCTTSASLTYIKRDIIKDRQRYNELVENLTSLSLKNVTESISEEETIMNQANEIVAGVIKSSLEFMKKEASGSQFDSIEEGESASEDQVGGDHCLIVDTDGNIFEQPTYTYVDFDVKVSRRSKLEHVKHMLLYQEKIDAARCLYAIRSVRTLLDCNPRLFTRISLTTPLSADSSKRTAYLLELMARHLRAMDGGQFYGDLTSRLQNKMVIDALFVVCLRSLQSWHPDTSTESLHDLRCSSTALLSFLLSQLHTLINEQNPTTPNYSFASATTKGVSSQQLDSFVRSILINYDLTKTVFSCLESTVHALQYLESENNTFTENFKPDESNLLSERGSLAFWWCGNDASCIKSFQDHLITLIRELVLLEYRLSVNKSFNQATTDANDVCLHSPLQLPENSFPNLQLMLLSSLLKILRLQRSCDVHRSWLDLMTFSLPYLTDTVSEVVSSVTTQLCRNLDWATKVYTNFHDDSDAPLVNIPMDYVLILVKSVQGFSNFALLQPTSAASSASKTASTAMSGTNSTPSSGSAPFSALGSIFNVFTGGSSSSAKSSRATDGQLFSPTSVEARKAFLRNLPRIFSCLALLTDRVARHSTDGRQRQKDRQLDVKVDPCAAVGESEVVVQNVLQILNPLFLHYGENLICALAIAWEKKGRGGSRNIEHMMRREQLSEQQEQLLNLACQMRSLRCDTALDLVRKVISQPPEFPSVTTNKKKKILFEERLLHFTLLFIREQVSSSLEDAWPSLLSLARECLAVVPTPSISTITLNPAFATLGGPLSSRCYFFILLIISEFVKRVSVFEDKKQQKELQDICVKSIEACNTIVDRSIEHGGWLGRRLPYVLLSDDTITPNHPTDSTQLKPATGSAAKDEISLRPSNSSSSLNSSSDVPTSTNMAHKHYYRTTVQALYVMSQVVANLLDVVYGSEEKDKTLPILTTVMTNTMPFLRTHYSKNVPSFRAATSLLASISEYQHTRKAWKKEIYDLFLASDFFRMPYESIADWGHIIDHLMTHDATSFKDFMTRLSMTRSSASGGTLNIFSNKEQEVEQRGMLLKRLAFVVVSSASNQYQRALPEIQERLSESIKFHLFPYVQEQVYLCFRVLLLRISPAQLTSLWPSIITELVQVLRLIEEDLYELLQTESRSLDGRRVQSARNRSNAPAQEKRMAMYLSACKLLDLALALQGKRLPHFKMFCWSFVGEVAEFDNIMLTSASSDDKKEDRRRRFVPHCLRIKRLMDMKNPQGADEMLSVTPMRPLLDVRRLVSFHQLHPFFNTIISSYFALKQHQHPVPDFRSLASGNERNNENSFLEKYLLKDFIEDLC